MKFLFCFLFFLAAGILSAADGPSPAANEDTLLLTWQRDPSTTMTLQWLEPGYIPELGADQAIQSRLPVGVPLIGDLPLEEWPGDDLLEVDSFATLEYTRHDAEVFSANMRMGWNQEGLMVWVRVQDPTAVES
ncbi:MAG: hypothetical protein LAT55_13900 [Opitutales bacterium]|nr:hypothetical protein [Opitutales bacterium]